MDTSITLSALIENRDRIAGNRFLFSYDNEPTKTRIENWIVVNKTIAILTTIEKMKLTAINSLLVCMSDNDNEWFTLMKIIDEWK